MVYQIYCGRTAGRAQSPWGLGVSSTTNEGKRVSARRRWQLVTCTLARMQSPRLIWRRRQSPLAVHCPVFLGSCGLQTARRDAYALALHPCRPVSAVCCLSMAPVCPSGTPLLYAASTWSSLLSTASRSFVHTVGDPPAAAATAARCAAAPLHWPPASVSASSARQPVWPLILLSPLLHPPSSALSAHTTSSERQTAPSSARLCSRQMGRPPASLAAPKPAVAMPSSSPCACYSHLASSPAARSGALSTTHNFSRITSGLDASARQGSPKASNLWRMAYATSGKGTV